MTECVNRWRRGITGRRGSVKCQWKGIKGQLGGVQGNAEALDGDGKSLKTMERR